MEETTVELVDVMERLIGAVEKLEALTGERVGAIVATVESEREAELARRLEEAEAKIAELAAAAGTRKTLAASHAMVGKHTEGRGDAVAIDGALASLTVEQRIAVKAELLRAGVLG